MGSLAKWLVVRQPRQVGNRLAVPTKVDVGLCISLDGGQPHLGETVTLVQRSPGGGDVSEGPPVPEC
jgi:hypothetical protein